MPRGLPLHFARVAATHDEHVPVLSSAREHDALQSPVPDEFIEFPLGRGPVLVGGEVNGRNVRRANGLVRLLGLQVRYGLLLAECFRLRRRCDVLLPIGLLDIGLRLGHGLRRKYGAVRAHIGNMPSLIEFLGDSHRVLRLRPVERGGLLLERRRNQGVRGGSRRRARRGNCDGPCRVVIHVLHVIQSRLLVLERTIEGRHEVYFGRGSPSTAYAPGRLGFERGDGVLALHYETESGCLASAGAQTLSDEFPQKRRNSVADHLIQNGPRLLGVHAIHRDTFWGPKRRRDGVLRDFVEDNTGRRRHVESKEHGDGIGNRLALPIIVGSEEDVRAFRHILYLLNRLRLVLYEYVFRIEVPLKPDGVQGVVEGPNMPHGRNDLPPGSEESLYFRAFRGRLDDEYGCHSSFVEGMLG